MASRSSPAGEWTIAPPEAGPKMKRPRTSGWLAVVLLLVLAAGPSFGRGRSSHPTSARRAFWRHSSVHGGCACSSCHESQADLGAEQ